MSAQTQTYDRVCYSQKNLEGNKYEKRTEIYLAATIPESEMTLNHLIMSKMTENYHVSTTWNVCNDAKLLSS